MIKLFGTDGIRGVAGKAPLTTPSIYAIGRAAGDVLIRHENKKHPHQRHRLLVVRDTRASGPFIFKTLAQGLCEQGVDVYDGGVLSTPAAAYLVRQHHFDSGAVISASHNPPEFNGIKFFSARGRKWPDEWEGMVEKTVDALLTQKKKMPPAKVKGEIIDASNLAIDYENFLIATLPSNISFASLSIALDCSNGANSELAPRVFERLGAKLRVMANKPTGKNINVRCGSQHTEKLAATVTKHGCDIGVAFDGDGDRVIFSDEKGGMVDGDHTLAVLAQYFKKARNLKNHCVVITVMANLGLKKFLSTSKIRPVEVSVGDRHVSAAMDKHGAVLGGEQSGHIILGHYLPTGDGLLTSLHVIAAMITSRRPLSALAGSIQKYPQVLLNIKVKDRRPLHECPDLGKKIQQVESILKTNGRVLVRYSGTEPLLRIMLEGPDEKRLDSFARDIASAVPHHV